MPRMVRRAAGLLLGAAALAFLACRPAPPAVTAPAKASEPEEPASGPAWFADVTDAVGLDFVHDPGPTGAYFMPQSMGSGAAVIRDGGELYLYLVQNGGPASKSANRLYKFTGGKFADVSAGSGLDVAGHGMGVAVGDADNDGRPDVLLTEYGRVRLFLNRGGGRFTDVTEAAGLNDPLWATSAAFFDYDRDGRLDLVVVNYVDYQPGKRCNSAGGVRDFCAPAVFTGTCAKLFHNRGSPGKPAFADVSFDSGLGQLPGPGLGVVCADFDGDGWPDVFVANDGQPNRLWMNRRDGTFRDEAVSRGVAYTAMGKAFAGMGVALGDVDNDGLLDLYVTHLTTETNTLWKQGPRGLFRDLSAEADLTAAKLRGTGFGTVLADFDHDGRLDLAVVNGRVVAGPVRDESLGFWAPYAERNRLFAGDGAGKFRDVSASNPDFHHPWNVARGLVALDYDGDGATDLLVRTIGGRARLYRNVAPNRGHWLKVRALDPKLNRDAYGAEVAVRAGGKRWVRLVNPAGSYLCSGEPGAHFGLGDADRIDDVTVSWPDEARTREVFRVEGADRAVELRKGAGRAP
jgi:hypothetical protein